MNPTDERIPLLLIHGFPHDRTLWQPQVDALKDVARPISPDLRGFGDSGAPDSTMTMTGHADDLKGFLDGMNVRKVVLCGLSMGGYVALAFLNKYPETVEGLVLCNTRATADAPEVRRKRQALAKRVLAEGMVAVAEELFAPMMAEASKAAHPDRAEAVLRMMRRQRPEGVAASAQGMAMRPDRTPMLPHVQVPTLIITGDKDELIPVQESEAMQDAIPGSQLVVIPGAGHLTNVEAPDAFNNALRHFLTTLR
jgi:3-oxoadipate enol-lactonase